jgi:hypothetical protein
VAIAQVTQVYGLHSRGTVPHSLQPSLRSTSDLTGLVGADVAGLYHRHHRAITLLMAGFNLRYLNQMHRAFSGDLLLPLVIGELGLRHLHAALTAPAAHAGGPFRLRLPQTSMAGTVPRETVRRAIHRLADQGWLTLPSARSVCLAERAIDFIDGALHDVMLDDFLWTTDRIAQVIGHADDPARRESLRADLAKALSTRREELVAPLFSSEFVPPARVHGKRDRHTLQAASILVEFWVRHLHRLKEPFAGDLILPLLLGEVAHYNIGALAYRTDAGLATLDAMFIDEQAGQSLLQAIMRPCNAHSLSVVTGVPDSTVRRKLDTLVARGWLAVLPNGSYVVTPAPGIFFASLNAQTLRCFIDAGLALRQVL